MKINTDKLLQKLKLLAKAQSSASEIGTSLVFHKKGIMLYTGETFIHTPFESIGDFSMKVDKIIKFLEKSKNSEYDCILNEQKSVLTLTDGKKEIEFAVTLTTQIPDELRINIDNLLPDDLKFFDVPTNFEDGVRFSINATQQTKGLGERILQFVHVTPNYMEATDSNKYAQYRFSEPLLSKDNFLIDGALFNKTCPQNIMKVAITDTFIYFITTDDVIYSIATVTSKFIPMQDKIKQIASAGEETVVFNDDIVPIVERIISVADKGRPYPSVVIKDGVALFEYTNASVKFKEKVSVDYVGSLKFSFEPNNLKQVVLDKTAKYLGNRLISFEQGNKTYICATASKEG